MFRIFKHSFSTLLCSRFPKGKRLQVWIEHNKDKTIGECFSCRGHLDIFNFEAGHVQAKSKGGSNSVSNLKPICRKCNLDMNTEHMFEYIKRKNLPGLINLIMKLDR